jgi:hypothetical protein
MRRRIVALLCAVGLAAGLTAATAGAAAAAPVRPAHTVSAPAVLAHHSPRMHGRAEASGARIRIDQSGSICDSGDGLCVNDSECKVQVGNPILAWEPGSNCDDFTAQPINPCNSTPPDRVTPTCPFTVGSGFNTDFDGDEIYDIQYAGGDCVATNSYGFGVLNGCPNGDGNGGADGTIMVFDPSPAYGSGYGDVVNRYWTDYNYGMGEGGSGVSYMCSQGANGNQIVLDSEPMGAYCEWLGM